MTKRPSDRAAARADGGPGGDRRRKGERRTAAEPLAAAWRPDQTGRHAARPRRGVAGLLSNYGWRVYAIPVLVVVTVLVVVDTAQHGGTTNALGGASVPPVATEGRAVPVDPGRGTAVLPPGDPFPRSGAGTWHVVPGNGAVVGTGQHAYHYQVAVEDGIDQAVYGGDDAFARTVDAVLADPRSWIASNAVSIQRVDAAYRHPDFIVSLTTPNTDHRPDLCGFTIQSEASCWRVSAHRVVINLARWVRGALAFNGDLGLYRQYAVNHEVGHVFGNEHVGCAANTSLAPVMMQQSFGVSDDYVWQLNQVDPNNMTRVPNDGRTCHPNAWPYPQGPGADPNAPPG